jgi:diaminopimelate decarboxylase
MFSRNEKGHAVVAGRSLDELLESAGVSTPAYVYDLEAMATEARELSSGFGDQRFLVAYAVKANSAGSVVRALAAEGCGAEVGSAGELAVAQGAGIEASRLLLSGMAKSLDAIDQALMAGSEGMLAIQVDAVGELTVIAARAREVGRIGRVALRLNPGVMADTHEAIATGHDDAKFGITLTDLGAALEALESTDNALRLVGVGGHVGSQLTRLDDYLDGAKPLLEVAATLRGLEFVDLGGGFGIDYGGGCRVRPADFARAATKLVRERLGGDLTLIVEPGRSLVGPHGTLVASVVVRKESGARRWLVLDAGMTDLMRPALYGARHRIEPIDRTANEGEKRWRVVGPVCESTDDFGEYPLGDAPPTRVAIRDAGAYGFTMASQYNGRALPTEVFVHASGEVTVSRAGSLGDWLAERLSA